MGRPLPSSNAHPFNTSSNDISLALLVCGTKEQVNSALRGRLVSQCITRLEEITIMKVKYFADHGGKCQENKISAYGQSSLFIANNNATGGTGRKRRLSLDAKLTAWACLVWVDC